MSNEPLLPASAAARGLPEPLVVSRDSSFVEEVSRLAAATGAVAQVAATARAARQPWGNAPVVLVDADLAVELAALRLPRRDGVLLVVAAGVEPAGWQRAVAVGAEEVLSLRDDRDRLVDLLGVCSDGLADAPVVCVTGGCGGAGASVFAAALAYSGHARGLSSVLVDADPWSGGVDLLVGGEGTPGLRWPDLAATTGRVSAASLREVLPVVDDLAVLSWGRDEPVSVAAGSMRAVLTAARRGHRLVVVDVARRDDDAVLEALAVATSTLLVVPAEVRAVAAARARLAVLRRSTAQLRLVVRTTGSTGLDVDDVATSLELSPAAVMRPERGLAGWLDQGLGPLRRRRGPLARAAATTLDVCCGAGAGSSGVVA